MTDTPLGRLEQVDLRSIWETEPDDFTPWLADNLDLLGNTLGIKLELEEQEKGVGPYRADVVCKEEGTDNWVLIENQLEVTNHTHLGQILTYAAGLNAVTIAWIARQFTDEHRAALDWLNQNSTDNLQFFGLEIEVWQIGGPPPAPKFNIVAKPNTWTKGGGSASRDLTPRRQIQLSFWEGFRKHVVQHSRLPAPTKPAPRSWMRIPVPRGGFHLAAIASFFSFVTDKEESELRAELVINHRAYSFHFYKLLLGQKPEIEEQMGEALTWHTWEDPESARVFRILVRQSADLEDLNAREGQYVWLLEKLEKLHEIFAERVQKLATP